jgi:hypothetical protein
LRICVNLDKASEQRSDASSKHGFGAQDMHYILFYEVRSDYVEKREQFRNLHLNLARAAYDRGELMLGGAMADPIDGAMLIFAVHPLMRRKLLPKLILMSSMAWSQNGAFANGRPSSVTEQRSDRSTECRLRS